jgi:hypothetical protein
LQAMQDKVNQPPDRAAMRPLFTAFLRAAFYDESSRSGDEAASFVLSRAVRRRRLPWQSRTM